jgi:predicted transcriptional regulator
MNNRNPILPANAASLPFFEALASEVRLKIVALLADSSQNVKELAQTLGLSSAMMVHHLNKLEAGGIIRTEKMSFGGLVQRRCTLVLNAAEIQFPQSGEGRLCCHQVDVPIGQFTDCRVEPTCGLASAERVIGQFDDPRYFLAPERVNAAILWFARGFVEYRIPNFLTKNQTPTALEISMEIGSEAPGVNSDWPSDIHFTLNGHPLGFWTCPGDFADRRGRYTPDWWSSGVGQYGMLKILRITEEGAWIDGEPLETKLSLLDIRNRDWTFRISVPDSARHVGGATLYGKGFGNHPNGLEFRLYYR